MVARWKADRLQRSETRRAFQDLSYPCRIDLKTRTQTQVAGSDGICCPRWSPDGRWVLALSGDNQRLLLLDMSTQKWRQVADKIRTIGYMTWSRDSKYVGFDTSRTTDPAFLRVSPNDGQVVRVVSLHNIRRFFPPRMEWIGPRRLPLARPRHQAPKKSTLQIGRYLNIRDSPTVRYSRY